MTYKLRGFIEDQAKKSIAKYNLQVYRRIRDRKRHSKRTGKKAKAASTVFARWKLEQQFNPFYVRAKSSALSYAIEEAIKAKKYAPRPALDVPIPKESGGHRTISIFCVPDAAVGTWLQRRLERRNAALLSESAFGYRSDRNANDAIQHIADALKSSPRAFVVEYDFAKFFDSIDHSYLLRVLKTHFHARSDESAVLNGLLASGSALERDYKKEKFTIRTKGIPQGNSISLFLANAVCYELDKALEGLGVVFARYADDVVVVAKSYQRACSAADAILRWSEQSKVRINHRKSDGISLLIAQGSGEIKSKNSIDFLGCELSGSGVRPAEKRITRLKNKISYVIYRHLLQAPKKGAFNTKRVQPDADWDLVTCINEIRKILYGRLSEGDLSDGLDGKEPLKPVRSHMSGFAMVDQSERFRELDGWLVGALERACALRASLVSKFGSKPLHLTRKSIVSGDWYKFKGFSQETRLPSSFRVWLYIRKYFRSRGIRALPAPTYDY